MSNRNAKRPNPRREELHNRIVALKAEGKSFHDIAELFNVEQVPKLQGHTPWRFQNVYSILNYEPKSKPLGTQKKFDETTEPWMFAPLPWTPPPKEEPARRGTNE